MIESITNYLAQIDKTLAVFIVSMLPIVELRGAIPIGVGFGLDLLRVFVVSVVGNMIPVPFVILFIRPIIEFLSRTKYFSKFANWFETHTMSKSDKITKYKMFGLFVFVAIPLPGTGAWTGAALAGLMDMRLKDSVPMIFLGVVTAGIIMMIFSHGLFNVLFA